TARSTSRATPNVPVFNVRLLSKRKSTRELPLRTWAFVRINGLPRNLMTDALPRPQLPSTNTRYLANDEKLGVGDSWAGALKIPIATTNARVARRGGAHSASMKIPGPGINARIRRVWRFRILILILILIVIS